jgi:predicted transposase/invertase (TIGR01784 family)
MSRYINPFTDFGFKKIFGEELSDELFIKAFNIAEMSKFTKEQTFEYEASLKYYRDFKNSLDTSFNKGLAEGEKLGLKKGKLELAKGMKLKGISLDVILDITGLSKEEIEDLN